LLVLEALVRCKKDNKFLPINDFSHFGCCRIYSNFVGTNLGSRQTLTANQNACLHLIGRCKKINQYLTGRKFLYYFKIYMLVSPELINLPSQVVSSTTESEAQAD
jgi:hypothetical protein